MMEARDLIVVRRRLVRVERKLQLLLKRLNAQSTVRMNLKPESSKKKDLVPNEATPNT
jgi:hypothetical protein